MTKQQQIQRLRRAHRQLKREGDTEHAELVYAKIAALEGDQYFAEYVYDAWSANSVVEALGVP